MSKGFEITLGNYSFVCTGNGDYGICSVYIFKDGKPIMHQSWSEMPTEEQAKAILEAMNGGDKK